VELNSNINSEISNLKFQISTDSITSNQPTIFAKVGQATEATIADVGPTTPTYTGVEKHNTQCVSNCNVSYNNTTHLFNVNNVQGHANVRVHSEFVICQALLLMS
jgi:hypothetical protein